MSKHKCPKCGSENTKETNIAGKIASDVASGIFLGGALILRKMLFPNAHYNVPLSLDRGKPFLSQICV